MYIYLVFFSLKTKKYIKIFSFHQILYNTFIQYFFNKQY